MAEKIEYDVSEDILTMMRAGKGDEAYKTLCARFPDTTVQRIKDGNPTPLDCLLTSMGERMAIEFGEDYFKKGDDGRFNHDVIIFLDINAWGNPKEMIESGNYQERKRRKLLKHYRETGEIISIDTSDAELSNILDR